jgi:hypothetical protein
MAASIVNILKKLPAFWLRIFSGWYPAVKVAGGIYIHPLQIVVLANSPFQIRKNREWALKSWIFRLAKPPP